MSLVSDPHYPGGRASRQPDAFRPGPSRDALVPAPNTANGYQSATDTPEELRP
ncbi:hypothetical protein [Streptomyces solincola]|uniref:hypothetical protein n=1 Tax=Streptomyces solincola TaxID=2100817 RepID=UPI0015E42978|nr:hypothetical protein [Streptomyces solincola]